MFFFSNAQETSGRFGKYVAEYQQLFKADEVSYGSPEDFFRLASKLAYDEKFRSDFTALTSSIGEREEGRLTLTRILTIIAIAMGGVEIEKWGNTNAVQISLVVVFLAGIGGWSESEVVPDEVAANIERKQKVANAAGMPTAVGSVETYEEIEATELEHRLAAGPEDDLEGLTASLFTGPARMKEALNRLEINTLELKHHLDSIDNRMDRIEPHLDGMTSRFPLPGEQMKEEETNGKVKLTLPVLRYSQAELERPVLALSDEGLIRGTPSSLQLRRLRRLIVALAILLVVLAATTAVIFYFGNDWHRTVQAARTGLEKVKTAVVGHSVSASGGSNVEAATPVTEGSPSRPVERLASSTVTPSVSPSAKSPAVGSGPASTKSLDRGANSATGVQPQGNVEDRSIPTLVNGPRKIASPKEEPKLPTPEAAVVRMPGGRAPISESVPPRPVVRAEVMPAAGPAGTGESVPLPSSGLAVKQAPVFVASGALSRNVISAPKPTYPSIARAQKVQGDVVLQATISDTGFVESVGIVSGPAVLQKAAVDALKGWRYRPYLVNGKPAEVRTFVNFHFTLDH